MEQRQRVVQPLLAFADGHHATPARIPVAGGQGHLKGQIVRIAHCGYYGAFDIVVALSGLELALRDLGHDCEPGAAAGAAQRVFAEAGAPEPVG